ncbi:hypothetical protein FQA47_022211 [Oryzias melastigma]|uniref:Uncharacterized protein n=1 Tax=Oryzias melastigma TaxID=30732 RepID=A0A834FN33_ORYME|nr:hypothetical protein FQA47_022211 [Oryzias melastigma]
MIRYGLINTLLFDQHTPVLNQTKDRHEAQRPPEPAADGAATRPNKYVTELTTPPVPDCHHGDGGGGHGLVTTQSQGKGTAIAMPQSRA